MNEHVENYCIEYIENEVNPQFAILIKGEWGCGKTYFINNLISRYREKGKKIQSNEIVYISLFGIGQLTEIDERLFQKMHPILSSEQFKYATGFIRSAVNAGIKISSAGTINVSGFDLMPTKKIKSTELKKKLIIVDDIERTNLYPSQIFGYFSEYLYQLDTKLIFIGNEDKIIKIDGEKDDYQKIKEKTIGVEFSIKPEIERAINTFIKELSLDNDMEYIMTDCLEAISILNCKNLRTVRQCLFNLKLLHMALNKEILEKNGKIISKIFINLFIQKSLNTISDKNQIRDAIIGFDEYKMNYNKYKKMREEKNLIFDYYTKSIPLNSIWSEIIFDGDYSKQKIITVYQQEEDNKKTPKLKNLFILIGNWRDMNKELFKNIIDTVNNEFENGVYLHPGEILHYTNIMVIFCEWKLVRETRLDFIIKTKKSIGQFKEKIIPINDWGMLDIGYGGWGYSNIDEIKEMRIYLNNLINENLHISLGATMKEEIKEIKNNVQAFCQNIKHVNGTNKYYRKPYLKLIDIYDFFNELNSLTVAEQSLIVSSFEERYGIIYSNGSLYSEYKEDRENLVILSELYDNSLGDIEYNPPELLKRDISNRLHKLVEYFNGQNGADAKP
jgi:hypothetical protein